MQTLHSNIVPWLCHHPNKCLKTGIILGTTAEPTAMLPKPLRQNPLAWTHRSTLSYSGKISNTKCLRKLQPNRGTLNLLHCQVWERGKQGELQKLQPGPATKSSGSCYKKAIMGKIKKLAPVAVAAGLQWHTAVGGFCWLVWHSAGWQREDIRKDIFSTEANSIICKAS